MSDSLLRSVSSNFDVDEFGAPASVRAQSAIVRSLVDALALPSLPSDAADALRAQLDEELVRLGTRIEEAAALDRARKGQ